MSRWRWLLMLFTRKLWLRVSVMALVGVATAAAGIVLAPYVPNAWTIKIGAQAIDGILNVLASGDGAGAANTDLKLESEKQAVRAAAAKIKARMSHEIE